MCVRVHQFLRQVLHAQYATRAQTSPLLLLIWMFWSRLLNSYLPRFRDSWKDRITRNGLPVTVLHCSLICAFTSSAPYTCDASRKRQARRRRDSLALPRKWQTLVCPVTCLGVVHERLSGVRVGRPFARHGVLEALDDGLRAPPGVVQ